MVFMKATHYLIDNTVVIEIDEDKDDVHVDIDDIPSGSEEECDCKSSFVDVPTSLKPSYCLEMP